MFSQKSAYYPLKVWIVRGGRISDGIPSIYILSVADEIMKTFVVVTIVFTLLNFNNIAKTWVLNE